MTKNSASPAQLALLDKVARVGRYNGEERRTADVLIRTEWIEQRPEEGRVADGMTPWYITDEGSRIRSNGADDF